MTKVLIVDDSPVEQRLAGRILEKSGEADVAYAANGAEALALVEAAPPDAVLTDMQMPEKNGLELIMDIRSRHPAVPVILMTAHGSEALAVEALQAGAASYVPKRNLATDLVRTLERVLAATRATAQREMILDCMVRTEADFCLDNDPDKIPPLVAHLQQSLRAMKWCDPAEQFRVASALTEALDNAVLHGNLEMNSQLRDEPDNAYRKIADERRTQLPYKDRRVYLYARFSQSEAVYVVRDEGLGFDPLTLPDPTNPENLLRPHGRGILLIKAFMDEVAHNKTGNEILMAKRRKPTEASKA